jgi:DNA mismatch endonuclease, patch repair protein
VVDIYSKAKRSEIMSAIRSRGNKATELAFVRLLRQHKIRGWRRHGRCVGRPDFVFPKKIAVFLDGCFWHGCSEHFSVPKTNAEFWEKRVRTNRARDQRVTEQLKDRGWTVIRIWQHELRGTSPVCLERLREILAAIDSQGSS